MSDYGGQHQAIRRANLPYAYGQPCARCGRPMLSGQDLDLDHTDDRAGYRGFAHARCNRQAGARLGNARRRERTRRMFTECALGVEISEDRWHTAIAAAGEIDGFVVVELAAYLDGTDAAAAVLDLRAQRTITAVAVDPHSPGATLIKPLAAAELEVTELSTSDVVVAYGEFVDKLAGGRLRHAGQPQLDAAVRHAMARPLGGATTWQRRGTAVDMSPLTAATFAVWAREHIQPPSVFVAWA